MSALVLRSMGPRVDFLLPSDSRPRSSPPHTTTTHQAVDATNSEGSDDDYRPRRVRKRSKKRKRSRASSSSGSDSPLIRPQSQPKFAPDRPQRRNRAKVSYKESSASEADEQSEASAASGAPGESSEEDEDMSQVNSDDDESEEYGGRRKRPRPTSTRVSLRRAGKKRVNYNEDSYDKEFKKTIIESERRSPAKKQKLTESKNRRQYEPVPGDDEFYDILKAGQMVEVKIGARWMQLEIDDVFKIFDVVYSIKGQEVSVKNLRVDDDQVRLRDEPEELDYDTLFNGLNAPLDSIKVGTRLSLYWPNDGEYYSGSVHKAEIRNGKLDVLVIYDDGSKSDLSLPEDPKLIPAKFRFVKKELKHCIIPGMKLAYTRGQSETPGYPCTVRNVTRWASVTLNRAGVKTPHKIEISANRIRPLRKVVYVEEEEEIVKKVDLILYRKWYEKKRPTLDMDALATAVTVSGGRSTEATAAGENTEQEKLQENQILSILNTVSGSGTPKHSGEYKYLVKLKEEAYVHSRWRTKEEIHALGGERKLINFHERMELFDYRRHVGRVEAQRKRGVAEHKINYYNGDYRRVDRVIGYHISRIQGEDNLVHVKWRSLQYSEATWEREPLVNQELEHGKEELETYHKRQAIPDKAYLKRGRNYPQAIRRPNVSPTISETKEYKHGHKLRDYQVTGVNWMIHNWHKHVPCILADEMGLGKTVQTVTFIDYLHKNQKIRGPYLIVAPLSTLGHWEREFKGWTDLNCVTYIGNAASREQIRSSEWNFKASFPDGYKKLYNRMRQIILTTKEILMADDIHLSRIPWNVLVVDEAHCLKNPKARLYRTMSEFPKQHCLLLTGTPIQNNMKELFALLHFMDPINYPDLDDFMQDYGDDKLAENSGKLRDMLQPRLLRRLKSRVAKEILARDEQVIWVELTLFQKKWYKALYEKNVSTLKKIGSSKSSLMNVAMDLRKCCNHPFLMDGAEESMTSKGSSEVVIYDNLVKACGKLVLLDKLLPKLKADGHRVLIFSQMSRMLDIIDDYLRFRGHQYERIDGSITGNDRQEAIDRFQRNDDIFAFILTTKAGGVGINLMAADTVIVYDSDWNPMNDLQAIARAHRIGQKKKVKVYRLITQNSYEKSMFQRADRKLALNKVVMGEVKDIEKTDVNMLLKQGAISMFIKDKEKELDKRIEEFQNASIEEILLKRTEAVKHDGEEATEQEDMFSEAVFVAESDTAGINLEDKNFWEQLGIEQEEEKESLILYSRRRRNKISYAEKDIFRVAGRTEGSDYEAGSDEDDYDSMLGLVSALGKFAWGEWDKMESMLSNEEKLKYSQMGMIMSAVPKTPDGKEKKKWDDYDSDLRHRMVTDAALMIISCYFRDKSVSQRSAKRVHNQFEVDEKIKSRISILNNDKRIQKDLIHLIIRQMGPTIYNDDQLKAKTVKLLEEHANTNLFLKLNVEEIKTHASNAFRHQLAEEKSKERIFEIDRLSILRQALDLCEGGVEELCDSLSNLKSGKYLPEWWTAKHDQLLLKGFLSHGVARYEHSMAVEDGFDPRPEVEIEGKSNEHYGPGGLGLNSIVESDGKDSKNTEKQAVDEVRKPTSPDGSPTGLSKKMASTNLTSPSKKSRPRKWINETKQLQRWTTMIAHFRKEVKKKIKAAAAKERAHERQQLAAERAAKKAAEKSKKEAETKAERQAKKLALLEEKRAAKEKAKQARASQRAAQREAKLKAEIQAKEAKRLEKERKKEQKEEERIRKKEEKLQALQQRKDEREQRRVAKRKEKEAKARERAEKTETRLKQQAAERSKRMAQFAKELHGTGWKPVEDPDSKTDIYFWHTSTNKTTWDHPFKEFRPQHKKLSYKPLKIKYTPSGEVTMPIQFKKEHMLTMLGTIQAGKQWHDKQHIWPLGYSSESKALSTVHHDHKIWYKTEIVARAEFGTGPVFCITAEDRPGWEICRVDVNSAWTYLASLIKQTQGVVTKPKGLNRLGINRVDIARLIERLPNVSELCQEYDFGQYDKIVEDHQNKLAAGQQTLHKHFVDNKQPSNRHGGVVHHNSFHNSYHTNKHNQQRSPSTSHPYGYGHSNYSTTRIPKKQQPNTVKSYFRSNSSSALVDLTCDPTDKKQIHHTTCHSQHSRATPNSRTIPRQSSTSTSQQTHSSSSTKPSAIEIHDDTPEPATDDIPTMELSDDDDKPLRLDSQSPPPQDDPASNTLAKQRHGPPIVSPDKPDKSIPSPTPTSSTSVAQAEDPVIELSSENEDSPDSAEDMVDLQRDNSNTPLSILVARSNTTTEKKSSKRALDENNSGTVRKKQKLEPTPSKTKQQSLMSFFKA